MKLTPESRALKTKLLTTKLGLPKYPSDIEAPEAAFKLSVLAAMAPIPDIRADAKGTATPLDKP